MAYKPQDKTPKSIDEDLETFIFVTKIIVYEYFFTVNGKNIQLF